MAPASLAPTAGQPAVGPADCSEIRRGHRFPSRALNVLLGATAARPAEFRSEVVGGLVDALAGLRKAKKPAAWDAFQVKLDTTVDPILRYRSVRELNVLFGDGRALEEVKRLALDEKADLETRKAAIRNVDRQPAERPAVDL